MEASPAPTPAASSSNKTWIIVAVVVLGLCCILTICTIVALALLGPAIGTVYSSITPSP